MEYFDYDGAAKRILDGSRSWEINVEQLLEQSQTAKRERLTQELEQLEAQLTERKAIHRTLVEELEKHINRYVDQLRSLYTGFSAVDEDRSDRLKQAIRSFYRELRQERRAHWQDRQQLEQERRDLLHELDELENDVHRYLNQ